MPFAPSFLWLIDNWASLVRTPDQVFDGELNDLEFDCGVYFLIVGEGITYIGKTVQWRARERQHRKAGKRWDRHYGISVPCEHYEIIEEVEEAYLSAVMPAENVRKWGFGTDAAGLLAKELRKHWK